MASSCSPRDGLWRDGWVPWLTGIATAYSGPCGPGATQATVLISSNYYTYDNAGQRLSNTITTEQTGTGGAPEFNSQGNQLFNTPRVETYSYDDLERLQNVNYGDGETQSYNFDAMGNRAQLVDTVTPSGGSPTVTTTAYSYDAANRLLTNAVGGGATNSYTNDADGNTLTGGGRTNTWIRKTG